MPHSALPNGSLGRIPVILASSLPWIERVLPFLPQRRAQSCPALLFSQHRLHQIQSRHRQATSHDTGRRSLLVPLCDVRCAKLGARGTRKPTLWKCELKPWLLSDRLFYKATRKWGEGDQGQPGGHSCIFHPNSTFNLCMVVHCMWPMSFLGLRSNWDSALQTLVRPAVASNLKRLCNCVAKVATLDCLASTFVAVCGFRTIPGVCDAFRSTVGCCGLKWLLLKIGAAV